MINQQGFGADEPGRERGDEEFGDDGFNYDNTHDGPHDHADLDDQHIAASSDETELEELSLIDDDEPLPWLESDYDEEPAGADTGRIIGFALLSLVALALILAAVWFMLRDRPDPDLQPIGTTIAAPEGPIKERPEDAGGKTFEGTGNVAPNVGEGRTTEGRLGEDTAPKPSIDVATSAPADETGTSTAPSGVGVQVGAYSSRASANAGWSTLIGQTSLLQGVEHRVLTGQVDGSTVYRLQAVAGDTPAAERLCSELKDDGIACQVKR